MARRGSSWYASYDNVRDEPLEFETADTPEDAAAKLAIELLKQGALVKEGVEARA